MRKDKDSAITNIEISEEAINSKLKMLKPGKAPGMDGLVPKFLIETADVICKSLALIFLNSMESSMVTKALKKANVTAIFTNGPTHCPGNCRPVGLTSHIRKVLASIVRDVILNHVKEFNLINRRSLAL